MSKCTCHERDSSVVCDYCFVEGMRGHTEEGDCVFCEAPESSECKQNCYRRERILEKEENG